MFDSIDERIGRWSYCKKSIKLSLGLSPFDILVRRQTNALAIWRMYTRQQLGIWEQTYDWKTGWAGQASWPGSSLPGHARDQTLYLNLYRVAMEAFARDKHRPGCLPGRTIVATFLVKLPEQKGNEECHEHIRALTRKSRTLVSSKVSRIS